MAIVGIICGVISFIISLSAGGEAKMYAAEVAVAKQKGLERPKRSDALSAKLIGSIIFLALAACAFGYKAVTLLN